MRLPDYNWSSGEWESLPDTVFDKALKEKCSFFSLFENITNVGGFDFDLGDVSNLHIRGQSAARQGFLSQEFIEFPGRNPDEARFMDFFDCCE